MVRDNEDIPSPAQTLCQAKLPTVGGIIRNVLKFTLAKGLLDLHNTNSVQTSRFFVQAFFENSLWTSKWSRFVIIEIIDPRPLLL